MSFIRGLLTKWYALIAFLGTMLTAVLAVEAAFPARDAVDNPIQPIFLIVCIITSTWSFWCCPLIDAGDLRPMWQYEPKRRLRSLRATIWAPASLTVLILIIYITVLFVTPGPEAEVDQELTLKRLGIMLATLGIISVFTVYLGKVIEMRLKRTSAIRRACFQCGYDLRGNPSATQCPECGQKIEWR